MRPGEEDKRLPHFVLGNKAEHLNYTRRRRSAKYERFFKTFLKRDEDRLN